MSFVCTSCVVTTEEIAFARELGLGVKLCPRCDELKEAFAERTVEGVRRRFRGQCPAAFEFAWDIVSDGTADLVDFARCRKEAVTSTSDDSHQNELDAARARIAQQAFHHLRSHGQLAAVYVELLLDDEELLVVVADVAGKLGATLPPAVAERARFHENRVLGQLAALAAEGFGEAEILAIHCSLEEARAGRPVSSFAMAPFIREHVRRLGHAAGLTVRFREDDSNAESG